MGIAEGAEIFYILRVRSVKGSPLSLHMSYIPKQLCPDMLTAGHNFEVAQLCDILREDYGIEQNKMIETLEIVQADSMEAAHLGVRKIIRSSTWKTSSITPTTYRWNTPRCCSAATGSSWRLRIPIIKRTYKRTGRRGKTMGATIMWLGQAGFILKTEKGSLSVDPFCGEAKGNSERIYPPFLEKGSVRVDLVLTTHAHWDHFDPETYEDYVIPDAVGSRDLHGGA